MIGVTAFGLMLTPVFYVAIRKGSERFALRAPTQSGQHVQAAPAAHDATIGA
jgi:hypothetical protein